MSQNNKWHYSIIYQITQECPLRCDICLRFYTPGINTLTPQERLRMVDILKMHDVKSISVTGGEPLILKQQLFEYLKYLHKQKIHTALTSTGFGLTKEQVLDMNDYLDRMVISIRSLDKDEWQKDFGDTDYTSDLFDTVMNLLEWIKSTEIVLEVTSVLHMENIDAIYKLGHALAEKNPNVVWRIDEYFPIGLGGSPNRERFQLEEGVFDKVVNQVVKDFDGIFKSIKISSWEDRQRAPGLLITQSGDIMDSAGQPTGCNIMKHEFPSEFKMSKPWEEYRNVCRDWGWGDL